MQLVWDEVGSKYFEAGVDHGVLYLPDAGGAYVDGVAWNGLTTVTEKPSGASANPQYADNIKYLNLYSAEEFGATIEAYTYPDAFQEFDGLGVPIPGITVGQQVRKRFGLSYRTKIGNDVDEDLGYKLHLVYGCTASPSEKAYTTINDSPDGVKFSWDLTTIPVPVPGFRPSAILTLDSTKLDATAMTDLQQILYGDAGVDPALPTPAAVIALFTGTVTTVTPTQPAYNGTTHTITIPTVAGVTYYIGGAPQAAGAVVITADTIVEARPNAGYVFTPGVDDDWFYDYT